MTKTNTKTKTMTQTNTFRDYLVTFEIFDQSVEETLPDPQKDNDKNKHKDMDIFKTFLH